jgi:pentatricopeptide repeat protein
MYFMYTSRLGRITISIETCVTWFIIDVIYVWNSVIQGHSCHGDYHKLYCVFLCSSIICNPHFVDKISV